MAGHRKSKNGWVCQQKTPIDSQAAYLFRLQSMQESFALQEQQNVRNTLARFTSQRALNKYNHATRRQFLQGKVNPPSRPSKLNNRDFLNGRCQIRGSEEWHQTRGSGNPEGHRNRKKGQPPFPNLTEKEMARIISSMQAIRQYPEATYGIIPDKLPTIPGVGHKSMFVHENRIRALLTEELVSEAPNIRRKSQIQVSSRREKLNSAKWRERSCPEPPLYVPSLRNRVDLSFDVHPNDKELFSCSDSASQEEGSTVTDLTEASVDNVVKAKVTSSKGNVRHPFTTVIPGAPPSSRPESPGARMEHDGRKIPSLVIEIDAAGPDDLKGNCGELSRAMQQLTSSQSSLVHLKDEVSQLGQINKTLEGD